VKRKTTGTPDPRKKRVKHSKAIPEGHQKNESASEVEEQLKVGRKIMKEYRETLAALAKT
jgi:hypothetical protein